MRLLNSTWQSCHGSLFRPSVDSRTLAASPYGCSRAVQSSETSHGGRQPKEHHSHLQYSFSSSITTDYKYLEMKFPFAM